MALCPDLTWYMYIALAVSTIFELDCPRCFATENVALFISFTLILLGIVPFVM